jgi:mono/diheme cytochrome c family protein
MKYLIFAGLLMMSLVALGPGTASGRFQAGEEAPRQEFLKERVEHGQRTYLSYCASCHGKTGRGDGPVATDLERKPTDLTLLSTHNDGRFPEDRIDRTIDGRLEVRGHGTSEMPVWGISFQILGSDHNQEREVREKVRDLLAYLESIQR